MTPQPIHLIYARTITGEFALLATTKASYDCLTVLRTAGWEWLEHHPVPKEGFNAKWKWAEFVGSWTGEKDFTGEWRGW